MLKSPAETAAFQKNLSETGSYRTDAARPRPFLGRYDAWYYLQFLRLIYLGHRLVVRGEFDTKVWAAHSLTFLSLLEDCGADFEITGVEHPTRLGRPSVFIGNHMSMLQPVPMKK